MKFIRQLFTKNIGLKLISLILAFAVWRMIASEDIAEVGFRIPLELRNIPDGMEVVGDVVNAVNVRVRSSSRVIKQLSSADMDTSIDLSEAEVGEHTFSLTKSNVQAPGGVEVIRVIPTHVKLRLEKTTHRMVPVRVRWQGSAASGDSGAAVILSPKEVRVEGPETHVNDITQVFTDALNLKELKPGQTISVNLSIDDPTLRLSQEKVSVGMASHPVVSPSRK